MKKVLKWGAIISVSLIVIVIAALVIISMVVDVNKYKPEIEKLVTDSTQRSFSIGDDLDLTLFPWAGVSLSDIRLGNPSEFAEKDFVTAKSFEVRIKLLPLILSFFKEIEISRFIINEPRIALVKTKKGAVNWDFPAADTKPDKDSSDTGPAEESDAAAGKTPSSGLPISGLVVNDFAIENGVVVFTDHAAKMQKEVSAINLTVKDVSMDKPVNLSFSALVDNQPVSLEGSVGPLGAALEGGFVSMDLSLKALEQIALQLKGNLENALTTPGVDIDIALDPFSPRELMAALDQPFPVATSDPKALERVGLNAHVKGNASNVSITNGILEVDESKLKFKLNASEFSRPNLAFDLHLDQINLDRYLPAEPEETTGKKKAAPKTGAKKGSQAEKGQKTDYTPLRQLIMDGLIQIDKLTIKKAKVQDVHIKITAKNGIINLDPMKLNMYQGDLAGKASVDVRTDTPKSAIKLNVKNIQINPLLQDVAEKDILEGATQAKLSLKMKGDNAARIKKTLNGGGKLTFKNGAIKGIDLAAMVRNVKVAFGLAEKSAERPKTDFTELNAPFTIKNGLVNTPKTSLKSPLLRIIASGDADLVKETLDMRVEPKVVGSIKGQGDKSKHSGLMVPVVVSGTFAQPKFRPDLKSAATQELKQKILGSEEGKKLLEDDDPTSDKGKAKSLIKGLLEQ
jgi:AsmA protein